MQGKKDIADLFANEAKQAGGLGLDEESSDILIRNLNASTVPLAQGIPLTLDEKDTDDFKLVLVIFDASGSMKLVANDLIECVNDGMIPGLRGGAADQVGALRIAGLKFGYTVTRLWDGGWHPIADLPTLTTKEYDAYGRTALHQAVLDGIADITGYALKIKERTHTYPDCIIAVFTDGANNEAPNDPADVHAVLSKLSNEMVKKIFVSFDTGEQDYRTRQPIDAEAIALEMGFDIVLDSKPKSGETKEEYQKRFRNLMGVFSDVISSSVIDDASGGNTWQDDDDDDGDTLGGVSSNI